MPSLYPRGATEQETGFDLLGTRVTIGLRIFPSMTPLYFINFSQPRVGHTKTRNEKRKEATSCGVDGAVLRGRATAKLELEGAAGVGEPSLLEVTGLAEKCKWTN